MAAKLASTRYNNGDLDKYVQKIRKIPILTVDEEYQLAKEWREKGDRKAADKLVASHLRLVAKIANGYRGYGLPLSDLIAEGNLGMMQAIKHYDPERGFRLSTYAMWWIKANIQDYILHTWSLVKIGTTAAQKKLFFGLRKTKRKLQVGDELDLLPETISAIAKKLEVSEAEVISMHQRLSFQDQSLNAPVKSEGEGETEWQDWLVDDIENQEVTLVHRDEVDKRRNLLDRAMQSLNQREHLIFVERRLSEPPHTLEELSAKYGISRERVRQIEVKAFEKIKKSMKRLTNLEHASV